MKANLPSIRALSRTKTTPLAVPRTTRKHEVRVLTSLPAGKMVPLFSTPLLREDDVKSGKMTLSFEMMETVEMLMNAINVNVKAYLVPNLAFERFNGMDELNRSYEGKPAVEGGPVTPYIESIVNAYAEAYPVHKYMGKHIRQGQYFNTAYLEAYNAIWNFRAANRSPDLTPRARLDGNLAPAFWQHQGYAHIVPDFDQAVIDGEVPLNVTNARMPIKGLGFYDASPAANAAPMRETGGGTVNFGIATGNIAIKATAAGAAGFPDIFAELQQNGITVSLSNIEMAKKTQAFAKLRAQYTGHSDDYIIDLLMDGITVPEQAWRQPILLADKSTIFGMSKRYASDSGNLTDSVVNGATFIDLTLRVPQCPTGGIIMVVAEITPEQLFERQADPYLLADSVSDLPQYLRDTLDPEKVSVVKNEYVDIDHDTPNATFGYAPLNHEWNHTHPGIGGRFYRPLVDAPFDEDRQRIWAVETQNPTLSEDFYLCTNMHTKPFVVTNQDPFEVVVRGDLAIGGNTVFGGLLVEANNDYEEVLAEAPQDRIEKP